MVVIAKVGASRDETKTQARKSSQLTIVCEPNPAVHCLRTKREKNMPERDAQCGARHIRGSRDARTRERPAKCPRISGVRVRACTWIRISLRLHKVLYDALSVSPRGARSAMPDVAMTAPAIPMSCVLAPGHGDDPTDLRCGCRVSCSRFQTAPARRCLPLITN